jgi:hypothetical protein
MGQQGPTANGHGPPGRATAPGEVSRRRLLTIVSWGIAGGVVTGGVATALIRRQASEPEAAQLETVPTAALPQVEGTLTPDQAARLIAEARRCQEPLARVAIWHSAATPGGIVSIISGAYRSPRFTLAATATLVAIPFPAPYASGQGLLTVIGEAKDFAISLQPVHLSTELKGTLPIRVWWTPVGGCL